MSTLFRTSNILQTGAYQSDTATTLNFSNLYELEWWGQNVQVTSREDDLTKGMATLPTWKDRIRSR